MLKNQTTMHAKEELLEIEINENEIPLDEGYSDEINESFQEDKINYHMNLKECYEALCGGETDYQLGYDYPAISLQSLEKKAGGESKIRLTRSLKIKCGTNPIKAIVSDRAAKNYQYNEADYEAKRTYFRRRARKNRFCVAGFSRNLKRRLKNLLYKLRAKPIFYIGGADVLPSPLNIDEEKHYVAMLAQGDDEAKDILIERNLRLVVYIAKKFENAGINVEDLISIGTIGLIKAVNTFNPEKNIKLATYASRCIENEILMFLRRNNKNKGEVSFDEPLNIDMDGNELLLSDILGTENDVVYSGLEEEINRKLLMQAMSKLSQREVQIVEMRFGLVSGDEMTQKEVADTLGISQSYISRLEKKIISKLRKEIKKMT